jgi:uncharacterized protein YbjQ (UPF0145 family)
VTATPQQPQQLSIPQIAQTRLSHSSQPGASKASFLAYSDYLTLRQMGFEPIAGVVGISVVHIGGVQFAGLKQATELEAYSRALSMGRYDARVRMQEEGGLLGADAIFLDSFNIRKIAEEHEYVYGGTALRFNPRPGALRTANGLPFMFSGSVMTLFQIMRTNLTPVTYGYGICVYHVPHRSLRQALGQTFQNTEVPVMTDAWYTAREIALTRLQAVLEEQGSDTILGMNLEVEADSFGEHTATFRIGGQGWRHVDGLAEMMGPVDFTPAAQLAQGLNEVKLFGDSLRFDASHHMPPPPPPPAGAAPQPQ